MRRGEGETAEGGTRRKEETKGGGVRTFGVVGAHLSTLSAPGFATLSGSCLLSFSAAVFSPLLVLAPGQRPTFACAHEKKKDTQPEGESETERVA